MPITKGSDAEPVTGEAKFAAIAERMTRQNKNLNAGFMIHLPSWPKKANNRSVEKQVFNVCLLRTVEFFKNLPMSP
jgi:hypothetical protein